MSFNIAVATTDGENINQHFGTTDQFYIYQVETDGSYQQIAVRNVYIDKESPDCSSCGSGCNSGGCQPHNYLPVIVELIHDCKYILASRVGKSVEKSLKRLDITCFSIELPIDKAIKKIVIYENRLNKFKNNGGF